MMRLVGGVSLCSERSRGRDRGSRYPDHPGAQSVAPLPVIMAYHERLAVARIYACPRAGGISRKLVRGQPLDSAGHRRAASERQECRGTGCLHLGRRDAACLGCGSRRSRCNRALPRWPGRHQHGESDRTGAREAVVRQERLEVAEQDASVESGEFRSRAD